MPRRLASIFPPALMLAPGTIFILVVFAVPMAILARLSLDEYVTGGGETSAFTGANYVQALTDPVENGAILHTVQYGIFVTALTLLASYPIALFLARTRSRWRNTLLTLAVAPLLTADIVRVYGWFVILGPTGLVNSLLMYLNVIHEPIALIFNTTGTVIGLVEILMPYAVLTLFGALVTYDPALEEAAMSLGANRINTFLRVTLPMSAPGILLTALLVLVLTVSSYVTPLIMGGRRVFLVATEVYQQATYVLDWPLAAALAIILLAGLAVVLGVYSRIAQQAELRVLGR